MDKENHFRDEIDVKLVNPPMMSFIVPVFNVVNYISETLDSILAQSINDIEIILINDGSTDGSQVICERYENKYSQIKLIHQKNQGPSAARNAGLLIAEGKYISFIDSDDWISPHFVKRIVDEAERYDADIIFVNAWVFDQTTRTLTPFYDNDLFLKLVGKNEAVAFNPRATAECFRLEPAARKAYRKSFIDKINLKFPEGLYFEDYPVHYYSLLTSKTVALIKDRLFYYRIGRGGKITYSSDEKRFNIVPILRESGRILLDNNAGIDICANFVGVASGVSQWSIENVSFAHKRNLTDQLSKEFFSKIPKEWVVAYLKDKTITTIFSKAFLLAMRMRLINPALFAVARRRFLERIKKSLNKFFKTIQRRVVPRRITTPGSRP